MSKPNRLVAFVAYLVPVLGWLYAFLFRRDDEFTMHHAKQSFTLTVLTVGLPVVWAIFSWLALWIPSAGPLLAAAAFSLVMFIYLSLFLLWLTGMVRALRLMVKPLPLVGAWAERVPIG